MHAFGNALPQQSWPPNEISERTASVVVEWLRRFVTALMCWWWCMCVQSFVKTYFHEVYLLLPMDYFTHPLLIVTTLCNWITLFFIFVNFFHIFHDFFFSTEEKTKPPMSFYYFLCVFLFNLQIGKSIINCKLQLQIANFKIIINCIWNKMYQIDSVEK